MLPGTEVNIGQNTSRDNSPDPKPGSSASHCSPLMLRPIPNPAKPMTMRKRKLQKSEILTSTPIKEDQKQKYEKNKVKNVTKRLNEKSTKVAKKTNTKTDKDKKNIKKIKQPKKTKEFKDTLCFFCGEMYIEDDGKPIENWIRCDICQQWCHEDCTAFDGTQGYTCDNCQS